MPSPARSMIVSPSWHREWLPAGKERWETCWPKGGGGRCELTCLSQTRMLKSSSPVPVKVVLLGDRVFACVIMLRWGHTRLEWPLTPITGVLIKMDRFWVTQRPLCKMQAETGMVYLQAKVDVCWHLLEARGEPRTMCPPQNTIRNKSCWHFDFRNLMSPLWWKNKLLDWKNECEFWKQRVKAHQFTGYDFWEENSLIHSTNIHWSPTPCWILALQVRHRLGLGLDTGISWVSLSFFKAQFPLLWIWG